MTAEEILSLPVAAVAALFDETTWLDKTAAKEVTVRRLAAERELVEPRLIWGLARALLRRQPPFAVRYRRPDRTIAPRPSHVAASQKRPPSHGTSNSR